MLDLEQLSWPLARLGEGLEQLARAAGLSPATAELSNPPPELVQASIPELSRWLDWASFRLDLEVEAIAASGAEFQHMLAGAGPAILPHRDAMGARFLLLIRGNSRTLHLLGTDARMHKCALEDLRVLLCGEQEQPILAEINQLLARAGVAKRQQSRVRKLLLQERLGPLQLSGGWLLRLPPGTSFWRQLRYDGLPNQLGFMLGAFAFTYLLEIADWTVIGRGALEGRLDPGWLLAWVLILLSIIPLHLLAEWWEFGFALGVGRLLKQHLLAGALNMDLGTIRSQGAGQLLGRVMESQALESLALNGGFTVIIAVVELLFAAWILTAGAGGGLHLLLLLVWLTVVVGLSWRYIQRLRRWTACRVAITNDLIETMVGHRTRLAQELPARWHVREDRAIDTLLTSAHAMDRSLVPMTGLIPRGWLMLGVIGMAPAFVIGGASSASLAISLGGVLLANRALVMIAAGLSSLGRTWIAWEQAGPLFVAATQQSAATSPYYASDDTGELPDDIRPILMEARDLVYRYRPQGQPVLRGGNLTIQEGDRVLLEGPSGGGKSTLLALLTGLRQPESGLLLLNGLDRSTLGNDWRRQVTAAPQFHENHVFNGTFAFNLLMGRSWPPQETDLNEAEELCHELGLGGLLAKMPAGMQQMVGETGWQLSHGEKSRLYLARALLQKSALIVLDESFAALDPETLKECLRCALKRAPSLMVIAHP